MAQRGRPHKNKRNNSDNFQAEQQKVNNAYEEYIMNYVEGFVTNLFSTGQIKTIKEEDLQKYFANPDTYYKELSDLMTYFYISDGDIYQLYTLIQVLPTLNYKINIFDNSTSKEKNLTLCNKILNKIKYKSLTRDLLSQECVDGTVVCMWIGDKKSPYLFIFDQVKYVFPKYRKFGEWVCVVDLKWFDNMKEEERQAYFDNLSPYVTEQQYNSYKNGGEKQYIELPIDRTACLRINTLFRNQRLGIPNGTQALFDKLHKQTLRNLEKAICEKVIKNIVVLKIGSETAPEYANAKLNPNIKKKIVARVKQALTENLKDGNIPVIALPEYTDITFGDVQGLDALKKDKFEGVNNDISNDTGISTALTNGTGANFASAKLNLEILYKRIGIMLEGVEEVFNKLFQIILPAGVKDEYFIEFDKGVPLSTKEQVDILMKLHNMEGFSLKYVIDQISGVEWDRYVEQSIYEQETLKLQDKIKPYSSSYTGSGNNPNGAPTKESDNPNTVASKDNGGNSLPNASV